MKPVPRPRGVVRRSGLLVFAWVFLMTPRQARAGTSDVVTRVTCPALPTDMRAELEARAQVDLALRSTGGGELEVACDRLSAQVTWRPRGGGRFERTVSAAPPVALVDVLLSSRAELAEDAARAGPASPPEAPREGEPEPPPAEPRKRKDEPTAASGSE